VVGGDFTSVGGVPAVGLAAWDGVSWRALGDVAGGEALTCVYSLKSTSAGLFVGGDFASVDGVAANAVARLTGRGWEPLGSGLSGGFNYTAAHAFLVHDGELYLGGDFDHAGGKLSVSMARWREDMTPAQLARFAVREAAGGVLVEWESEAGGEFAVAGCEGGDEWSVAVEAMPGGLHRALDTSPRLAAGGEFEYRLLWRGQGSGWELLRSGGIVLAPPPPAPPALAARPNPFNPRVELSFSLPAAGRARLTLHDLRGRRVATLVDGICRAGASAFLWDGRDASGTPLASGVYFARLRTPWGGDTEKLVLLR
jgi:hypothetical protein